MNHCQARASNQVLLLQNLKAIFDFEASPVPRPATDEIRVWGQGLGFRVYRVSEFRV